MEEKRRLFLTVVSKFLRKLERMKLTCNSESDREMEMEIGDKEIWSNLQQE